MTTAYVQHGVYTNGAAPGLDASLFNDIETALLLLNKAITDTAFTSDGAGTITAVGLVLGSGLLKFASHTTVKNGSTSGTMTVYEVTAAGSAMKYVFINYNGYRSAAVANNDVTLGAPFSQRAHIVSGNCMGTQLIASGSLTNLSAITTLGSTGDGSATTTTKINSFSILETFGGFDTIREPGGNGSARTGNITIIGF